METKQPKMSLYIAGSRATGSYLNRVVVPFMEHNGIMVTSRWITQGLRGEDREAAVRDFADIDKAGAFMLMVPPQVSPGKYTEFGYAIRSGKILFTVAADKGMSCFFDLPNIRHLQHYSEVALYL
jgi:hypothetical protein